MNTKARLFVPLLDDNGRDSKISLHFGHAPYFGLYDFESNKLKIISNSLDHGNQNQSPVDQIIEMMNPTIVFAKDMGAKAIVLFTKKNISLKTGLYTKVGDIIDNFDNLKNLDNSCEH